MPTLSQGTAQSAVLASLYIQALRKGQALWFRVASGSMRPLLRIDDAVRIEPAQAEELEIGEIVAFETAEGLLIHRIVHRRQTTTTIQFLQMGDGEVRPSWIEQQAVVGRVVAARRGHTCVDLQLPLAKWWGKTTALTRYRLYSLRNHTLWRNILRAGSFIARHAGHRCIYRFCRSSQAV